MPQNIMLLHTILLQRASSIERIGSMITEKVSFLFPQTVCPSTRSTCPWTHWCI